MLDRTRDFLGAVEAAGSVLPPEAPGRPGLNGAGRPSSLSHPRTRTNTHTYARAQEIATAIREVSRQVDHLKRLCQRKGLFEDVGSEINTLTATIKATLARLDEVLREFVSASAVHARSVAATVSPSTPRDKAHVSAFWHGVCEVLQAQLLSATNEFQAALRTRSDTLKEQAARRRELSRSTWAPIVDASNPLFAVSHASAHTHTHTHTHTGTHTHAHSPLRPHSDAQPPTSSVISSPFAHSQLPAPSGGPAASDSGLRRRHGTATHTRTHTQPHTSAYTAGGVLGTGHAKLFTRAEPPGDARASDGSKDGEPGPRAAMYAPGVPLAASSYTAQQLAQYRDAATRASEMRDVEASIVELGHMYTRMATLVAEQGEVISRIDADVDETSDNVAKGIDALQTFYRNMLANRSFILKLFGVVLLVIVLFAIFKR